MVALQIRPKEKKVPGPAAAPQPENAPPTPEAGNNVGRKLMAGLSDPVVRAALLQFGVNMMQPQQGSFMGHLGRGLASAGAAAGRADQIGFNRAMKEQDLSLDQQAMQRSQGYLDLQQRQLERGAQRDEQQGRQAEEALEFRRQHLEFQRGKAKDAKEKKTGGLSIKDIFKDKKAAKAKFATDLQEAAENAAVMGDYPTAAEALKDKNFVDQYTEQWRLANEAADAAVEGKRNASPPTPDTSNSQPAPSNPASPVTNGGRGDFSGAVRVAPTTGGRGDMAPGPAPAPTAAPTARLPAGVTPEGALAEAKAAIARGAPRERVIERLRGMGINPAGL